MELNKIYNENCLETMARIPNGSIDFMLTDPPYGLTQNEWDIAPDLSKMWKEWERILKPKGVWCFTSQFPFSCELIQSKIEFFRYDLIWYKPLGSGHLNSKRMPLRNHEHILIFYRSLPTYNPQMELGIRKKGKRKTDRNGSNYGKFSKSADTFEYFDDNGKRYPQSVIEFTNGDRTKEADHPTQKPVDLFRYLIRTYTNEGENVFDGYMGSGTTAAACIIEKRNFIGSEIVKDYFKLAQGRLSQLEQQLTIF